MHPAGGAPKNEARNSVMAQVTVLRASHLIDGTGADPVDDGAVVVVDGEISAVGRTGEINLPSGAGVQTYDYPGCTLLPGLIDSHTHLLFSASDQALDDAIH